MEESKELKEAKDDESRKMPLDEKQATINGVIILSKGIVFCGALYKILKLLLQKMKLNLKDIHIADAAYDLLHIIINISTTITTFSSFIKLIGTLFGYKINKMYTSNMTDAKTDTDNPYEHTRLFEKLNYSLYIAHCLTAFDLIRKLMEKSSITVLDAIHHILSTVLFFSLTYLQSNDQSTA
eukprot:48924_1